MEDWYVNLQLFAQVALSIFIEAAPFLLLGSLLGAVIEVYLGPDRLARLAPKNRGLAVLMGFGAGLLVPTCECGVVPVARRLMAKGLPTTTAITFLLSAPVVNPVVLAGTYVAFRGDWSLLLGRLLLVAVPAVGLGLALGEHPPRVLLRRLSPAPADPGTLPGLPMAACGCAHDHDHGHEPGEACGCGHDHGPLMGPRPLRVLTHAANEFLDMGKFLVMGALVAAAFKSFVPFGFIRLFEGNLFLAVGLMMFLAVVLAVCSEADAFVAASFSSFPPAALLAFVSLGPMVDLKLIPMYLATFHRLAALALILVPPILIYPLAVLWGRLFG